MSIIVSLIIGSLVGLFLSRTDTICVKGGHAGCVLSSALGAYVFGGIGNTIYGVNILSFNSTMIGFSIMGAIILLFIITRLNKENSNPPVREN